MRLATRRDGTRDGSLVLVSSKGDRFAPAGDIAPTLQGALDEWDVLAPRLAARARQLDRSEERAQPLSTIELSAPLPRAYEWIDGSAYIQHIVLVRRARGAEPPPTLETDPLVYQGGSGVLLGPNDDIELINEEWGLDFEAEISVILKDTPRATPSGRAGEYVALLMLANDVSYRNLVPVELEKGFGFFNSKPATAFSPFAVTPDELGDAWRGGRLHLRMRSILNGELVGEPEAGPEMHFSFFDLIAHITKTRSFVAGTILGSGTVSNEAPERGVSCIAERRMREILERGKAETSFLKPGDHIVIEMKDQFGRNIFGSIDQKVAGG